MERLYLAAEEEEEREKAIKGVGERKREKERERDHMRGIVAKRRCNMLRGQVT